MIELHGESEGVAKQESCPDEARPPLERQIVSLKTLAQVRFLNGSKFLLGSRVLVAKTPSGTTTSSRTVCVSSGWAISSGRCQFSTDYHLLTPSLSPLSLFLGMGSRHSPDALVLKCESITPPTDLSTSQLPANRLSYPFELVSMLMPKEWYG